MNSEPIPYGRQDISEEDIQAVVDVLRSDYLTQGPVVPEFERTVAEYCSASHAIAVNSATSALHIACLALQLGPGDLLWTSAITFVASANCALYCGAKVDFIDIDAKTYNISIEALRQKLELADKSGQLPKVVIPVHLCGQSCDMAAIHSLSQQYGFSVIEDASHAIGGKYSDELVGNCRYSDITVFSFHPVKIITTAEGGMALTNDAELANRMKRFRSHGITSLVDEMYPRPQHEIWNYQQIGLGFNYRMTDLHAALGIKQMIRLDQFVAKRHELASRYDRLLNDLPVTIPWQSPQSRSSYHLYPIRLQLDIANRTHREVYQALGRDGILVNLHYIPVYRQPYYEKMGFTKGYCPEAEQYYSEVISIPMYPGLTEAAQDRVIESLKRAVEA